MSRRKLVQAAPLTVVPAVSAHGKGNNFNNFETGNDLLTAFKTCDRIAAEEPGVDSDEFFNCAYLSGFIEGISEADEEHDLIVMPSGSTKGQTQLVVRKYLEGHPEALHHDAVVLVEEALVNAWPSKPAPKKTESATKVRVLPRLHYE